MKTCRNCGTVAEDTINFCQYCGGSEFAVLNETQPNMDASSGYTISQPDALENVNGNIPMGIIGAFIFSILGAILYFAIYQAGIIAAVSGFVMFILAQYGYKFFSKGNIKLSLAATVVSVIMMVVMIFVAEYACLTYDVISVYDEYGLTITVGEALEIVPELFNDPEVSSEIGSDLAFAYIFGFACIIGNIVNVVKNRKALKNK